jgi:hypothetical protein
MKWSCRPMFFVHPQIPQGEGRGGVPNSTTYSPTVLFVYVSMATTAILAQNVVQAVFLTFLSIMLSVQCIYRTQSSLCL